MFNITIGNKTKESMKILEIESFPFTESDLKSNYRQLAKINHPDKLNGSTSLMKKINGAYSHIKNLVIKDDELELKKEDILKAERKNEDIFELFDTCKDCNGTGERVIYHPISIDPCDRCTSRRIFFGWSERVSTGKIKVRCKSCRGSGKFKQQRSGKIVDCRDCSGNGYKYITCPKCKGHKTIFTKSYTTKEVCYFCGGAGKVKINPFNPVIPKGAVL